DDFESTVFAMEPGEISPPVKTKFGFHIIKLIDKKPNATNESFGQMRGRIERQLTAKRRGKLAEEFFEEVLIRRPIKVDSVVTEYLLHKRTTLYPPQLLDGVPTNDFDEDQLDRDEREMIIATWDGGQMKLIDYLLTTRRMLPLEMRPQFSDRESIAEVVFQMNRKSILSREAEELGVENSDFFKRRMSLFKQYTMADVMRHDSIEVATEPKEVDIHKYYLANIEDFAYQAKVHIYEIQVSDELLAGKLAREIKSLDQFKKKAAELTERPGLSIKQGDMGYIEEKWFPELFSLAWETPNEQVGGPVLARGKYSVIFTIDRSDKTYKDFLEVKESIESTLQVNQNKEHYANWIEERRANTHIEVFKDLLWDTIDKDSYELVDQEEAAPGGQ
ncbi:MAG: hypothetical protein DRP45_04375, partial [Candidatus Zixiibacteriota bacterium]